MRYFGLIFSIFIVVVLLISCENENEKKAIGQYEVVEFKLKNKNIKILNQPLLSLKDNNQFELVLSSKTIKGKWVAGDNGDITWITFITEMGSNTYQLGDSNIIMDMPNDIYLSQYASITFQKVATLKGESPTVRSL